MGKISKNGKILIEKNEQRKIMRYYENVDRIFCLKVV